MWGAGRGQLALGPPLALPSLSPLQLLCGSNWLPGVREGASGVSVLGELPSGAPRDD